MTRRTSPLASVRRRLAQAATALLLSGTAVLAAAGPASAHDQLVSTSPAAGTTVSALPSAVTLTFSDVVVAGGADANLVRVTDASCTQLNTGPVQVQDNVVTQKLDTAHVRGPIHVVWRVVSQDGHPVSGDFTFTVAGGDAPATTASCDPGSGKASGTTTSVLPWVVTGGILVLVIAGVGTLLVTRSRRTDDR